MQSVVKEMPTWLAFVILGFCLVAPAALGLIFLVRRVNRGKDLKIGPDAES